MQTCIQAPFRSTFAGKPVPTQSKCQMLNKTACHARPRRLAIHAKIDTGYKKTAGADGQKSTVEDQLHEAEADKNTQSFVKEFKQDLGATGDKKSEQDKQDIKEREDDKVGLERSRREAAAQQQQQQQ